MHVERDRFDEILLKRQRVAQRYISRLGGSPALVVPTIDPDVVMSWFVFVVRLSTNYSGEERDAIIKGMN